MGGANALEGTLEVCFGGAYGTICDDRWDELDATVACRQLGYTSGGKHVQARSLLGKQEA